MRLYRCAFIVLFSRTLSSRTQVHVFKFHITLVFSIGGQHKLGNNLPSYVNINSDVSVLIVHIQYIWEDILFAILNVGVGIFKFLAIQMIQWVIIAIQWVIFLDLQYESSLCTYSKHHFPLSLRLRDSNPLNLRLMQQSVNFSESSLKILNIFFHVFLFRIIKWRNWKLF